MKNIWEKVKDFTSPYAADDDYDEEYDDMDDGFEEEESSRYASRSRRERRAAPVTEESGFESGAAEDTSVPSFGVSSVSTGFNGHVVGSAASNKQQLVLLRPETFNDAPVIATNLRQKKAVVLNLENVDKALARRVVDFLSGCTYAVDGSVKKVAHATYLFCPSNMEISGDLQALAGETESYV
jgi:cell division inhibitor SepF